MVCIEKPLKINHECSFTLLKMAEDQSSDKMNRLPRNECVTAPGGFKTGISNLIGTEEIALVVFGFTASQLHVAQHS